MRELPSSLEQTSRPDAAEELRIKERLAQACMRSNKGKWKACQVRTNLPLRFISRDGRSLDIRTFEVLAEATEELGGPRFCVGTFVRDEEGRWIADFFVPPEGLTIIVDPTDAQPTRWPPRQRQMNTPVEPGEALINANAPEGPSVVMPQRITLIVSGIVLAIVFVIGGLATWITKEQRQTNVKIEKPKTRQ